ARARNGISGVAAHDFQNGRFNSVMRVNGNQIREAGLVRGQMPFAPNTANMRFSDRQVANIPRSSQNTRFFAHQQPNPVQRMQQNRQIGGSQAPVNRAQDVSGRAPQGTFRNGGAPANAGGNQVNQNDSSGWR